MCGGYTVTKDIHKLTSKFKAELLGPSFVPRYNARPGQNLPIIVNTDPAHIVLAHWGIDLGWAQLKKELINTRSESLTKPTFKKAYQNRRCLILADGFYEWVKTNYGKQPYYFSLKNGEPFAFAGIYNFAKDNGEACFSIITTEPNEVVKKIHNRMPVILKNETAHEWLNQNDETKLAQLLGPYSGDEMTQWQVSMKVNSSRIDLPELINPLP